MPAPQLRPNILLLMTDQQRFDTIQALGSNFPQARTPHMDALARAGVSFDNAFCTAPVCCPSRATLMTGLHPQDAGVPGNLSANRPPLSPALHGIGKRMRAAGYETAYFGKWHLGGSPADHGFERAFECSLDEATRLEASRYWKDRDWMNNDRPFFNVVSFLDPHDLYFFDPADRVEGFRRPWTNTGEAARASMPPSVRPRCEDWPEETWGAAIQYYCELIERVDREIGELLHQLRCSGFAGNTWIIFCADHGNMSGEHDLPFKGPFMYEGVVRVPLMIVPPQFRFTGSVPPGTFRHDIAPGRREQLCSLLDIVPTVLDLAGIPAGAEELPGRSLVPLVHQEGEPAPHQVVFAMWDNPRIYMGRSRDWKYVLHEGGVEELYHLAQDPAETCNLASDPEADSARAELRDALKSYLRGDLPG